MQKQKTTQTYLLGIRLTAFTAFLSQFLCMYIVVPVCFLLSAILSFPLYYFVWPPMCAFKEGAG